MSTHRHHGWALLALSAAAAVSVPSARAADDTWTGLTHLSWSTAAGKNWSLAPLWNNAAIDTAIFAGAAPGTVDNGGATGNLPGSVINNATLK